MNVIDALEAVHIDMNEGFFRIQNATHLVLNFDDSSGAPRL